MKKIYLLLSFFVYGKLAVSQFRAQPSNPNFFPIAVWLQQPWHAQVYKNAGVNLYIGLWNGLDQAQLTDLKNAGMKVMCDQNTFALSKLSDTTIYGWTEYDEPDNAQWNANTNQYDPCIAPSVVINTYNGIKTKDSSRPVFLNLGQGVSYINWVGRGTCSGKTDMYPVYKNGYIKGCDIISFDIYPVNSTDATTSGKLWYVPKGVDSLKLWSAGTKPVWCWIEVTKIDNNSNRQPTAAEVKAEVWMALIHGATGFGYFCHSWTPSFNDAALLSDATMLSAVTAINTQVTSLAAILNSTSTSGYASVSSSNSAVPIDVMTKNYGGANYIFAVGMRSGITTATFTVASGSTVQVLGESRTLTVSSGKFTDNFASYGVHLYKINPVATSINETENVNAIRIYPNPVTDKLFIEPIPTFEISHYEIFNILGKKVSEAVVKDNAISVAELPVGVYFIKFINVQESTAIQRFVKN